MVILIEQSALRGESLTSVCILRPSVYVKLMSCTGYKLQHDGNIEAVLLWETLNTLRGDAKHKFKVHGCHRTVHTVGCIQFLQKF